MFFCAEISIIAREPIQTLPSASQGVSTLEILICILDPPTLEASDYTTRWITPSGDILTEESFDPKGTVINAPDLIIDGIEGTVPSTILFLQLLSYLDSGNYTCQAKSTSESNPEPVSAVIQLQLLGME